jgi:hypothetical protein
MLLKEFISFDKKHSDPQEDGRYRPEYDTSVLTKSDFRKTPRLTLRIINDIRKQGETREQEMKEELGLIRKMYAAPPPESAPV